MNQTRLRDCNISLLVKLRKRNDEQQLGKPAEMEKGSQQVKHNQPEKADPQFPPILFVSVIQEI